MSYMPDLTYAFMDDVTIDTVTEGQRILRLFSPGLLTLTSGKVATCDPLTCHVKKPFERTLPTGKYPVILSIAHNTENHDERVAFARLQIRENEKPVRWEMAILTGQDVATLDSGEFFGYGVDAGTGSFMDWDAFLLWQPKVDVADQTYVDTKILSVMRKNYTHTWDWGNFTQDENTGLNVITFSSGYGDGVYPSYWGFNESNEIVCLVTNFMVLGKLSGIPEEDNE